MVSEIQARQKRRGVEPGRSYSVLSVFFTKELRSALRTPLVMPGCSCTVVHSDNTHEFLHELVQCGSDDVTDADDLVEQFSLGDAGAAGRSCRRLQVTRIPPAAFDGVGPSWGGQREEKQER